MDVLSVVAVQVKTIQDAIRSKKERWVIEEEYMKFTSCYFYLKNKLTVCATSQVPVPRQGHCFKTLGWDFHNYESWLCREDGAT